MFMLRFDFRLSPQSPASMGDLYATALDMSAWGEEHGAASILFSEHHRSPDGYLPSPLPLAAAAAARTSTIPISVGALLLLMYDPVKAAEDIAVLDHLSGGRITYTIGLGYRDEEYAMFGIDPRTRGKELDERLDVLLRALRGEEFDWRGRRVLVTPAPATPGGPMVAVGGGSVGAARRAGRRGLLFIGEGTKAGLQEAYEAAAADTGVEAPGAILPSNDSPTTVFVADDVDDGWDRYGPYMVHDATVYGAWMEAAGSTGAASYSPARTVDDLRAENGPYRVVTPDEAAELIRTNGMLGLQPLCGGVPPEDAWRSLELVASAVMPQL